MNLDLAMSNAQIAFALLVIASAVVYYVFGRRPTRSKKN